MSYLKTEDGKILMLNGKLIDAPVTTGTDTSDADATQSDILEGKTAYVNGNKIIGTHVCPTTTIDSSYAKYIQAGEVIGGVTGTNKMAVYDDVSFTDTTDEVEMGTLLKPLGVYEPNTIKLYEGCIIQILPDSGTTTINYQGGTISTDNLIASNIKSGVSILGVTGTYEGSTTQPAISFDSTTGTLTITSGDAT